MEHLWILKGRTTIVVSATGGSRIGEMLGKTRRGRIVVLAVAALVVAATGLVLFLRADKTEELPATRRRRPTIPAPRRRRV
jgi:hypothetical protein